MFLRKTGIKRNRLRVMAKEGFTWSQHRVE
jgi:hypothetical protein